MCQRNYLTFFPAKRRQEVSQPLLSSFIYQGPHTLINSKGFSQKANFPLQSLDRLGMYSISGLMLYMCDCFYNHNSVWVIYLINTLSCTWKEMIRIVKNKNAQNIKLRF